MIDDVKEVIGSIQKLSGKYSSELVKKGEVAEAYESAEEQQDDLVKLKEAVFQIKKTDSDLNDKIELAIAEYNECLVNIIHDLKEVHEFVGVFAHRYVERLDESS